MKTWMRKILSYALAAALGATVFAYRGPLFGWIAKHDEKAAPTGETGHSAHAAPPAATATAERKVLYWVDPMHPAYTSDKPGIAPDCGMQLEPVYADDAAKLAHLPPGTIRLTTERQQLIGVRTGEVALRSLRRNINATARLAFDETRITHVHTKVEGWIEEMMVNTTGETVRAGQPMFTIYSPELVSAQQEYLVALKARKQMADGPLPELARSAESLLAAARERLRLWDVTEEQIQRLEQTGQVKRTVTFYAPHSGIVMEKRAFQHMRVTQDTDLYTIADLSRIWAIADVYEYEAPFVRVGQRVVLSLSYVLGQTFVGRVSFIYPDVDPQTRTLKVRLEFSNPGQRLKPEMYGTAVIDVDLGEQLLVAADAVVETGRKQMVFLARGDGYFEPREVMLGPRTDGFYTVLDGLRAGDTVVTSANFLIDSESRLKAAVAQMGGTASPEAKPPSAPPPHQH